MLSSINRITGLYQQNIDFDSSNVSYVCTGFSDDDEPKIGCSWDGEICYWYDVSNRDIDNLEQVINSNNSVGGFMAELKRNNQSYSSKSVSLSDFDSLIHSNQVKPVENVSLTIAFTMFFQAQGVAYI